MQDYICIINNFYVLTIGYFGSVAERVKALFLWRPYDHNRLI